ncbi:uncharacterized protein LOC131622870 [Vicia villosa]|uniref:uncharacterized protein LOC131622870 n=1 Tax=Vicia villosa TaxID=3911 RepID=UPI00273B99E3|nr:uncharacterized protein LOC131622870 [Vicia villosa]
MDKWRNLPLSKEEEEGVTAEGDEVEEVEVFQRTLVGKLWTENNFNVRAFTSTIIGAWRLKNPVETQEIHKNLFLFKFASKRDLDSVLKNGPWGFDRNLLILDRVTGEEQPSGIDMHFGTFWVRVYDLPLLLRSEPMAKKIGDILGSFEEMDMKDAHRNGKFLRIKVKMDLKKPLKRGTVVRYKEKSHRVFFKYERLPTFCFICGRVGHQMKDCEEMGDLGEEGYEDIDEQDLSYGIWLRASPLPKVYEDQRQRESSSGNCTKSLFLASSSHSRCENEKKEKGGETEVEQEKGVEITDKAKAAKGSPNTHRDHDQRGLKVESVAESLGAVELNSSKPPSKAGVVASISKRKTWSRKKGERKPVVKKAQGKEKEIEAMERKRQLIDVVITEGTLEDMECDDVKRKRIDVGEGGKSVEPEVVLNDQHRLHQ